MRTVTGSTNSAHVVLRAAHDKSHMSSHWQMLRMVSGLEACAKVEPPRLAPVHPGGRQKTISGLLHPARNQYMQFVQAMNLAGDQSQGKPVLALLRKSVFAQGRKGCTAQT